MTRIKLLTASAGLAAAIGMASPAAAQYGYQSPNVVGQIINNVLGYGRYPYGNYGYGQSTYMSSQTAVNQCAAATEARLNNRAMNTTYNRWSPYNNPYRNYALSGQGRVLGIDRVQLRSNGRLKVTGVATSGRNYSRPFGYGSYAYNRSYGVPDLRFTCNADRYGRVASVNIRRSR